MVLTVYLTGFLIIFNNSRTKIFDKKYNTFRKVFSSGVHNFGPQSFHPGHSAQQEILDFFGPGFLLNVNLIT
jgi:hypothetical protein